MPQAQNALEVFRMYENSDGTEKTGPVRCSWNPHSEDIRDPRKARHRAKRECTGASPKPRRRHTQTGIARLVLSNIWRCRQNPRRRSI